jgi:hypothetical protein
MDFITDRTKADVLLETDKGFFNPNRLEIIVDELALLLRMSGVSYEPYTVYWPPGAVVSNADIIIRHTTELCQLTEVVAEFPSTMDMLTWEGANQIESALLAVYEKIKDKQEGA